MSPLLIGQCWLLLFEFVLMALFETASEYLALFRTRIRIRIWIWMWIWIWIRISPSLLYRILLLLFHCFYSLSGAHIRRLLLWWNFCFVFGLDKHTHLHRPPPTTTAPLTLFFVKKWRCIGISSVLSSTLPDWLALSLEVWICDWLF